MSVIKIVPHVLKQIFLFQSQTEAIREDKEKSLIEAMEWLERAQDASQSGGVSAWFSLLTGWSQPYIETTGYIINTFLDYAQFSGQVKFQKRAIMMADFLLAEQHSSGGFRRHARASTATSEPIVFNTGQDLLGLTEVYLLTREKKYYDSCIAAANFLCSIQEADGSWVSYTYGSMPHTYHTRVAWSLIKVAEICRIEHDSTSEAVYIKAACKNLDWALTRQLANGWFTQNELPPPNYPIPYTHTISYAVEGFLWSGLILRRSEYIQAALRGAYPLLKYFLNNNFLPGTFDEHWHSNDNYTCLTGNAQISLVWLELYRLTQEPIFLSAAQRMNAKLQAIQITSGSLDSVRGAIPGSWPIWGELIANKGYCRLAYLNWATKFFADSLLTEIQMGKR